MGFIDEIKAKAKANVQTIVLPETEDARTYEAAEIVINGKTVFDSEAKKRSLRIKVHSIFPEQLS